MKKIIMAFVLFSGIAAFANAQGKKTTSAEKAQKAVDVLTQKLSLTAEQKVKVSAILLSQAKSQDSIRAEAGAGADMKSLRPKMMARQKASDKQINALLTEDQKTAYAALKAERHKKGNVPR